MALDIFTAPDGELLDVEALADLHRRCGLNLVDRTLAREDHRAEAARLKLPGGDALSPEESVAEIVRLAAVGRLALIKAHTTPRLPIGHLLLCARRADAGIRARLGLAYAGSPVQPNGPPELVEI